MVVSLDYTTNNIPDVVAKISSINEKLSIDLDLGGIYIDHVYDERNQIVTFNFAQELNVLQNIAISNIINIWFYNAITGVDVYVPNFNNFCRLSILVPNDPTPNHDILSGYSNGSYVVTTTNKIFMCAENTAGNAIWKNISETSSNVKINFTNNRGEGLEINSLSDWSNLCCFSLCGTYTSLDLILYTSTLNIIPESGSLRIVNLRDDKVLYEFTNLSLLKDSNNLNPVKIHADILISDTVVCAFQCKGTGIGIHTLCLL